MTNTPTKPANLNEAKPTLALGKPTRIAVREPKKYPELAKAHKARSAWEWPKGSAPEKEARSVLTT